MSSYSEKIYIDDKSAGGGKTTVKVATGIAKDGSDGNTQTFNVFDDTQNEGNYSQVYRLQWEDRVTKPKLLERLIRTLGEMDKFLIARGAVKEGPRRV